MFVKILLAFLRFLVWFKSLVLPWRKNEMIIPLSVNYQLTRQCNYSCGFCFHTAKTSFVLPIDKAKEGLANLAREGMKKINFAGGEPFIIKKGEYLGELVRFCKEDLELESVTIVTNGSKVIFDLQKIDLDFILSNKNIVTA